MNSHTTNAYPITKEVHGRSGSRFGSGITTGFP